MKEIIDIIAKIVNVKSIVTFGLVYTVCKLALVNNIVITSEVFTGIVMAVITYYFTKSNNDKKGDKK